MRSALPPTHPASRTRAFTLIELLTVIAIIGILAAILIPTVGKVRGMAAQTKCLSSLRSAFTAAQLYAEDNRGTVVPGQTTSGGTTEFWSVKLLPYYGQSHGKNTAAPTFACPKWEDDKVSATAYQWGYALNVTPGYEGSGSTSAQKAVSVVTYNDAGAITSGTIFRMSAITHPTRRLFLCDSYQWHVRGAHIENGNSFVAYNRHGADRCNVIFFDGHAKTLKKGEIDQSIFDPGTPYVPTAP